MASDVGKFAQYRARRGRRVHMYLDGIEPQWKKMSVSNRMAFQEEVATQLKAAKRSTFRGDVALKLDLVTASTTPPHAHTIAKNLLDLLGRRMTGVDWPRKSLLYADDSQIQALSVMCRHGEDRPSMRIEARPFSAMINDLELATNAMFATETMQSYYERDREAEWVSFATI